MSRLNDRAFKLLQAEIDRCTPADAAGQVQRQLALKRLQKHHNQPGNPLSYEELRELQDLLPNLNDRVLQAAARANRPTRNKSVSLLTGLLLSAAGLAGIVWILNLPNPWLRQTVAQIAPDLLIPSFISMDYHYRQAIATVEQSDQLVNQATSAADLNLGAEKVKAAKRHLEQLPVWSLGYYPQQYCNWSRCRWRFTFDEFEQARKEVARMEARLFQEQNAQTQLEQAEQAVANAKQQSQRSPNQKQMMLMQWQQAIDQLQQIPSQTLAGRMAQTKQTIYEREFEQIVGSTTDLARSGNLIQAAKQFATIAQQSTQGAAHSEAEWQEIIQQWEAAIDRLQTIDVKDSSYGEAQKLLASYQKTQSTAKIRLQTEQQAVAAYEAAQNLTEAVIANGRSSNTNAIISQLQAIEFKLAAVKPGTTPYADAQRMKQFAEAKRKQFQK